MNLIPWTLINFFAISFLIKVILYPSRLSLIFFCLLLVIFASPTTNRTKTTVETIIVKLSQKHNPKKGVNSAPQAFSYSPQNIGGIILLNRISMVDDLLKLHHVSMIQKSEVSPPTAGLLSIYRLKFRTESPKRTTIFTQYRALLWYRASPR